MNTRLLSTRALRWLEDRRLLRVDRGALVRIVGWFAATVLVVAVAVGDVEFGPYSAYNGQIDSPGVRELGAPRGDERGFGPASDAEDAFRIAWIGGSSIQGVDPQNPTFLPDEVVKVLPEIDGRPVTVDLYFLSGMRAIDEYAAVLTALADEPDMIVVTLNPIWALNDRAVQGWDNLDGRLVEHLWDEPSRWGLLASVASPGDGLWAIANRLDLFDDRYHWGLRLADRLGDASLLDLAPPPEGDDDPSELEEIAAMQIPVFFWDRYSNIISDDAVGPDRQIALFDYIASVDSGLNEQAVTGILDAVAAADIPGYVYVAQFNDELIEPPGVDAAFAQVETRLAELGESHGDESVVFRSDSVIRTIDDLEFRDPIHIFDVSPVRDHLVAEFCEIIAANGWSSSCQEPS